MRCSAMIFGMLALASVVSNAALAQLVQVAPGYVRAPFVRVYWNGDGSSYVRAPFVSVASPGYGYWPAEVEPVVVRSRLSWQTLRQELQTATARFDAELDRYAGGDFWKKQFKTNDLATAVSDTGNQPPAEETRQYLVEILRQFDTVGSSPDLNGVANFSSFQQTRELLREYTLSPELRQRRQLFASAKELFLALQRFDTAAQWQSHLKLAPGMVLSNEASLSGAPVDLAEARDALNRFDTSLANPEYHMITELPSFRATHELLSSYLQPTWKPAPVPEELPRPLIR